MTSIVLLSPDPLFWLAGLSLGESTHNVMVVRSDDLSMRLLKTQCRRRPGGWQRGVHGGSCGRDAIALLNRETIAHASHPSVRLTLLRGCRHLFGFMTCFHQHQFI